MTNQVIFSTIIYSVIKQHISIPPHNLFPTVNEILQILEKKQDKSLDWIKDLLDYISEDKENYDAPLCTLLTKQNLVDLMKQKFVPENISSLVNEYYQKIENQKSKVTISRKCDPIKAKEKLPNFVSNFQKAPKLFDLKSFINTYGLKYDKQSFPTGIKTNVGKNRTTQDILKDLCNFLDCPHLLKNKDKF